MYSSLSLSSAVRAQNNGHDIPLDVDITWFEDCFIEHENSIVELRFKVNHTFIYRYTSPNFYFLDLNILVYNDNSNAFLGSVPANFNLSTNPNYMYADVSSLNISNSVTVRAELEETNNWYSPAQVYVTPTNFQNGLMIFKDECEVEPCDASFFATYYPYGGRCFLVLQPTKSNSTSFFTVFDFNTNKTIYTAPPISLAVNCCDCYLVTYTYITDDGRMCRERKRVCP